MVKKKVTPEDKEKKKKLKKVQTDYHKAVPDAERNPDHEKDFDDILSAMVKPIKKGK